jgi:hypothetical protein
MAEIADAFEQWLRDYVVVGLPGSGINDPSKAEGRAIGALIEDYVRTSVNAGVTEGGAAKIIRDCPDQASPITAIVIDTFRLPYGLDLTEVRGSLKTTSSSGDVTVDVKVGGVSILTDPITIDEGDTTSVGSAAPPSILTHELDDNTEVTLEVTGAGTGAEGLRIYLIGTWRAFGVGAVPYFIAAGYSVGSQMTGGYVAFPDGVADKDIALLEVFAFSGGAGTIVRPSGWSDIANPVDQGDMHGALFWKRCDGSESLSHQAVDLSSFSGFSMGRGGSISIWRGCVQSGDPFESYTSGSGTSSTAAGEPVTTLGANRRAVTIYQLVDTQASDPDTGWTENYDQVVGVTNEHTHVASSQAAPIPATVGAESRPKTTGADWVSHSLALVPGTA